VSGIEFEEGAEVIAIGCAEGGSQALRRLIPSLPSQSPGVVVVQEGQSGCLESFAARLAAISAVEVVVAEDGDRVLPGRVLIAPKECDIVVERGPNGPYVRLVPPEHDGPSVDRAFGSVAQHFGHRAVGAILTGSGQRGVEGLLAMREAGASTVAQDESGCLAIGMPRAAWARGAAQAMVSLGNMGAALIERAHLVKQRAPASAA
jgi:two-component system chemotaxis response regulator CheB